MSECGLFWVGEILIWVVGGDWECMGHYFEWVGLGGKIFWMGGGGWG